MGVPGDGLLSGLQCGQNSGPGLHTVGGPFIRLAAVDRDDLGRAVVLRQEGVQHPGADGVSAPGLVHRHTGQQLGDCGGTGALPLRPDETEGGGIGGDV